MRHLFVQFKFYKRIYYVYDLLHRSGFFAWFEALSEQGLVCHVRARTCIDGIQDGEPDPDIDLIFSIALVRRFSVCGDSLPQCWGLIKLLFWTEKKLELFIGLSIWACIWVCIWIEGVILLFPYWVQMWFEIIVIVFVTEGIFLTCKRKRKNS